MLIRTHFKEVAEVKNAVELFLEIGVSAAVPTRTKRLYGIWKMVKLPEEDAVICPTEPQSPVQDDNSEDVNTIDKTPEAEDSFKLRQVSPAIHKQELKGNIYFTSLDQIAMIALRTPAQRLCDECARSSWTASQGQAGGKKADKHGAKHNTPASCSQPFLTGLQGEWWICWKKRHRKWKCGTMKVSNVGSNR
ncbi:hypothetical protein HPB50_011323 [Hyalomma asiaticum]|uniref:Uncharacterized protein n=1 Tax=Hyalomma asiaticum TaxID=266040 RepID=A0ACB7SLN8_HYAAI|nr:hypothetical protein HPB50_011323 [Hyalomma asiaticum]